MGLELKVREAIAVLRRARFVELSILYERDGNDLISRGLYLDLSPWGYHFFELEST